LSNSRESSFANFPPHPPLNLPAYVLQIAVKEGVGIGKINACFIDGLWDNNGGHCSFQSSWRHDHCRPDREVGPWECYDRLDQL